MGTWTQHATSFRHLHDRASDLVGSETNLLRVMFPDGPLSKPMIAKVKEELLKGFYPNFCKLYRVALCLPVGIRLPVKDLFQLCEEFAII